MTKSRNQREGPYVGKGFTGHMRAGKYAQITFMNAYPESVQARAIARDRLEAFIGRERGIRLIGWHRVTVSGLPYNKKRKVLHMNFTIHT